MEIHTQKP